MHSIHAVYLSIARLLFSGSGARTPHRRDEGDWIDDAIREFEREMSGRRRPNIGK